MPNERVVGIDLGTTNSLIAYMQSESPVIIPGEDGSNLVPSIVALDSESHIVVGNPAQKFLASTPERAVYSVKRLMGRGVEDVQDELKLFPFRLADDLVPARCCASSWASALTLRRKFPPTSCASSSAMPSASSMLRSSRR